jgi:hypothetical protein
VAQRWVTSSIPGLDSTMANEPVWPCCTDIFSNPSVRNGRSEVASCYKNKNLPDGSRRFPQLTPPPKWGPTRGEFRARAGPAWRARKVVVVPAPTRPQSPPSCPARFDPLPPFPSLPPSPLLYSIPLSLLFSSRCPAVGAVILVLSPRRVGWGVVLLVPRDPVGGGELRLLLVR